MESTRQQKVSRLLQREFGDIFQKNAKTLANGKMITVTIVRISPDLGVAKIYLSIFPSDNSEEILKTINSAKSELRYELGKRVKNQLRVVPELSFFIDDSLDYVEKIDQLLTDD